MGLTIIAYRAVTPWDELSESIRDGRSREEDGVLFRNAPGFAARLAPLEEGYYLAEEVRTESIGGYSFYNDWRTWLSQNFPSAFQELIDFTDCDGCLGPIAVCSLCADFTEFEDRARDLAEQGLADGDDAYAYLETYQQFLKCFEDAGSDGVVQFT